MSASSPIGYPVSPTDQTRLGLLTPREVASILHVDPRTVRRWANDGRLERVRLGGRLARYRAEDVEAFIARRTQPSNDLDPAENRAEGKASDDALTTQTNP